MIRAAAGGAILFFAGIAAAQFMFSPSAVPPRDAAQLDTLNQRLDSLQRSVDALADLQSEPSALPAVTVGQVSPLPAPTDPNPDIDEALAARGEAIRAGNAIVDRALQNARWTIDDVARLSTATAALSGQDRAEIQQRLSAAINQDRLQVDPNAMAF